VSLFTFATYSTTGKINFGISILCILLNFPLLAFFAFTIKTGKRLEEEVEGHSKEEVKFETKYKLLKKYYYPVTKEEKKAFFYRIQTLLDELKN